MKKRIVSLLLLITMLLTSFAFAAEAEVDITPENEQFKAQSEKLVALGLWKESGKEAEEAISRGEFADFMMYLIGAENMSFGDAGYIDVTEEHPYYQAIAFAKGYHVMNGVSESRFEPNRTITYAEALKTLLASMGYEALAESRGGYPNGYMTTAASLGFTIETGSLTRAQAAAMLTEALDVYLLSAVCVEEPKGRILYSADNKETILSVYHNIEHVKGKMTDNGLSTLSGASDLRGKAVVIGGVTFTCHDAAIRRALGSEIDFYYREQDGEKALLWWDYAYPTDPLVLRYDMLNTASSDFTKTCVSYFEGDKTKKAKVDPRAAFIYNEIAYPIFTVTNMKLTNGTLTLYDGDNDGIYDIIYADVYRSFRVKTISNGHNELMDDFNRVIRLADYETVEIFNEYGVLTAATNIAVNNVLSAFEAKGREYLKLQISTAMDSGLLQGQERDGVRDAWQVNDKTYRLSDDLQKRLDEKNTNLPILKPGENYRIRLDFSQEIAAFDLLSEATSYAYFLAAKKESGLSDKVEVKAVLEDGKAAVLPCADKISVNRSVASAPTALLNLADLKDSATGDWKPQLIKIKTNARGAIYELETAPSVSTSPVYKSVGYDPFQFSMVFENQNANYYNNNRNMIGSGNKQYSITDDTVWFMIPPDGNADYIETKRGVLTTLGQTHIKGYDADASYSMGAVVVYLKEDVSTTDYTDYENYLFIVLKVSTVADADGAELKQLTAYSHSAEWKMVEQRSGIIADDIKAGDIVRLATDQHDRVTRCTRLVSTDVRPAPNAFNLKDVTRTRASYNGSNSVVWGYPVGVGPYSVTISTDETGGSIIHVPFYSSTTAYIEFDAKNLKCKAIKKTQIPITASLNTATNLFNIPDKDTMVLATTSSSGAYNIIVIKFGG